MSPSVFLCTASGKEWLKPSAVVCVSTTYFSLFPELPFGNILLSDLCNLLSNAVHTSMRLCVGEKKASSCLTLACFSCECLVQGALSHLELHANIKRVPVSRIDRSDLTHKYLVTKHSLCYFPHFVVILINVRRAWKHTDEDLKSRLYL